jgi:hypothetical protein
MLKLFDSEYEGVPCARLSTVVEHDELCERLQREGHSFKTKIVPPRGRTHRRPKGRPREIVVWLLK